MDGGNGSGLAGLLRDLFFYKFCKLVYFNFALKSYRKISHLCLSWEGVIEAPLQSGYVRESTKLLFIKINKWSSIALAAGRSHSHFGVFDIRLWWVWRAQIPLVFPMFLGDRGQLKREWQGLFSTTAGCCIGDSRHAVHGFDSVGCKFWRCRYAFYSQLCVFQSLERFKTW